jgi:hypothetical protein
MNQTLNSNLKVRRHIFKGQTETTHRMTHKYPNVFNSLGELTSFPTQPCQSIANQISPISAGEMISATG